MIFPLRSTLADDGTGDIYLSGTFTRYDKQTIQTMHKP
jgi:hypothetical protein